MSKTTHFIEQISIELGFDGEINDQVLDEADRRMKGKLFASHAQKRRLKMQLTANNK